ncbi:MFS transporter [Alteromonas aestuariivivens]|uniref:MFS transporter n=1 Tax=Alteromonas aestuariivivens TaxID=1938339 RepID=A0A3D8MEC8_9ALTE|nr:MFS transporter [Alteromonas aestuariivivens]RDV29229.1 MFS transporter [Alteromonas aestuariivivens]
MRQTLHQLRVILPCYGFLYLGNGLFSTLLSVRASIEGFAMVAIGIIMAAYFAGILLSACTARLFLPHFGFHRGFVLFALLLVLCTMSFQAFVDPASWAASRFVAGYCVGTILIITESWINSSANNGNRGRVLSVYMVVNNLALGCGQLLFSIGDPTGNQLFMLVSSLFILACFPLLAMTDNTPKTFTFKRFALIEVFKTAPLGMACALMAGLLNGSFLSLGPIYAQGLGLNYAEVGQFMALVLIGGLLLQWPIGWLSDKVNRKMIMLSAALLSLLGSLLLVTFNLLNISQMGFGFSLAALFYGAVSMTLSPIGSAYANDLFSKDKVSHVASTVLFSYCVGAISGPILASLVMEVIGSVGLFISCSVYLAIFVLIVCASLWGKRTKLLALPPPLTQVT